MKRVVAVILALCLMVFQLSAVMESEYRAGQEPAVTVAQAEMVVPAEIVSPTEVATPVETAAPMETLAPTETASPAKTAAPMETLAPTETASPAKTAAPTETLVPTETTTPAETAAPIETTGPLTILGFDGFDGVTALETVTVPYGTSENELCLPASLTAQMSDGSNAQVNVAWVYESGFSDGAAYVPNPENIETVYAFRAALKEDISCDLALPFVLVVFEAPLGMVSLSSDPGYTIDESGVLNITGSVNLDAVSGAYSSIVVEETGEITGGDAPQTAVVAAGGVISGGTFSGRVTTTGTITGGTFNDAAVINFGTISGGTFGVVENNCTISDGTFNGTVYNYDVISDGTFSNDIFNSGTVFGGTFGDAENNRTITDGIFISTMDNNNVISGGTFGCLVTNRATISGGTYGRSVTNNGIIFDGSFNGTVINSCEIFGGTYSGGVCSESGCTISGGTFSGDVGNYGTIYDGTFNGTVDSFPPGEIHGGTFNGIMANEFTIVNGIFSGTVINRGAISGGTFDGDVTNNGTISNGVFSGAANNAGIIQGGTFSGAVTNTYSIGGGTFNGAVTNNGLLSGGTFAGGITGNTDALGSGVKIAMQIDGQDLEIGYGQAIGSCFTVAGAAAFMDGAALYPVQDAVASAWMSGKRLTGVARAELSLVRDEWTYGDTISSEQFKLTYGSDEFSVTNPKFKEVGSSGERTQPPAGAGAYQMVCAFGAYDYVIAPKTVSVQWPQTEFVYDGSAHMPMATFTDLSGGSVSLDVSGSAQTAVGTYSATAGTTDANYELTGETVNWYIRKATPSVIWPTGLEITYGQALSMASLPNPAGGTFRWETPDRVPTCAEGESETFKLIYTPGNGNYSSAESDVSVRVIKKVARVTPDNKAKTYGDADPGLTATVEGTIGSDALDYTLSRDMGENVGEYDILVTLGTNPNYEVTTETGTLTIGKKTASVTPDDKSKTYGDTDPALTATVTGAVGNDVLVYTLSRDAGENVGEYGIFVTPGTNPNYEVTTDVGTLTIGKKAASVTPDDKSKTYGDTDPALTAKVTGAVGNDVLSYTLSRDTGESAGEYDIIVIPGENPNYLVSADSAENAFTIAPKPLTDASVTVSTLSAYTDTGKKIRPVVVLHDGGVALTKDVDYAVAYENNREIGTATVTITGVGNYTGTLQCSFEITARNDGEDDGAQPLMVARDGSTVSYESERKRNMLVIAAGPDTDEDGSVVQLEDCRARWSQRSLSIPGTYAQSQAALGAEEIAFALEDVMLVIPISALTDCDYTLIIVPIYPGEENAFEASAFTANPPVSARYRVRVLKDGVDIDEPIAGMELRFAAGNLTGNGLGVLYVAADGESEMLNAVHTPGGEGADAFITCPASLRGLYTLIER